MATLSNNDIAEAIYLISKDKRGNDLNEINKKIINFLSHRRLFSKITDILDKLDKTINKETGRLEVRILSKEKLREKLKNELIISLKERYKVKEIYFKEVIDEKLIGGVRVEIGDEVIDLTVKNKIKKLQEHLIRKI